MVVVTLVLDVSDPYNPVEVARYLDRTGPNDGLVNDFWGVYKEPNSPWIYGSDRNGGLYIFKELGAGILASQAADAVCQSRSTTSSRNACVSIPGKSP